MEVKQNNNNNNYPSKKISSTNNNSKIQDNSSLKTKKYNLNETLIKINEFLDNSDVDTLNTYLAKEKIDKKNLNDSLCLALQKYIPENKIILEFINILLKKGSEPDCRFHYIIKSKSLSPKIEEKDNVTGLMYSCLKGDLNLIQVMLQYKQDINKKDKNGRNALFYTILSEKGENLDIVKLLVNYGINVNCIGIVETGRNTQASHSPLSLAAINNLKDIFLILIEKGADVNFQSLPDKDSILHIAVKNENLDIIKIILKCHDLKIDEGNKDNVKPFEIAMAKGNNNICNMIIERLEKDNIENFHDDEKNKNKNNIKNNNNNNNNIFSEKSKLNNKIKQKLIFAKILRNFGIKNKSSIQIPIFFSNKFKNDKIQKLDTFLNIDPVKQPTLTIDLSQEKLDYELEINQLRKELLENSKIIKNYEIDNNNLKNELKNKI